MSKRRRINEEEHRSTPTTSKVLLTKTTNITPKNDRRKRGTEEVPLLVVDDDIFGGYTPMKDRKVIPSQSTLENSDVVVAEESVDTKPLISYETLIKNTKLEGEDPFLKRCKEIKNKDDIVFGAYGGKKSMKGVYWPMRRVTDATMLNTKSREDLESEGLLELNTLKSKNIFLRIEGDIQKKWILYPEPKVIEFEENPIKQQEFIKRCKTNKRKQLEKAIQVANEMLNNFKKKVSLEEHQEIQPTILDEEEDITLSNIRVIPPSSEELKDHEPIPCEFIPGMKIFIKYHNQPQKECKIYSIEGDNILLDDSTPLTDEMEVGVGKNEVYHLFSLLKRISTFQNGTAGVDFATTVKQHVDQTREHFLSKINDMENEPV